MTNASGTRPDPPTNWRDGFRGGIGPLLAVLMVVSLVVLATNVVETWIFGGDATGVVGHLTDIPPFALIGGIALLALRYEETRLRDIGLGRERFLPALGATVALLVAVNLVALGLALRDGGVSLGFVYDDPPTLIAAAALNTYLFNGPAEELLNRGYLQNKLAALLDGHDDRLRSTVGIVGASVLFALLHVPTLLQQGVAPGRIPLGLLPLLLTGVAFGAVYELTRNLYLVAMLHGIGNYWPLFVEGVAWPNWPVLLVLYVLVVWAYRQWAGATDRSGMGLPA